MQDVFGKHFPYSSSYGAAWNACWDLRASRDRDSHSRSSPVDTTQLGYSRGIPYRHFCMGEKQPSEKPQVWGTWMPGAAPFPIPPWALLPGAPGHNTELAGHSMWKYSWNQPWDQTALWEIWLFLHLPPPAARRQVSCCDVTVMEHRLENSPDSWSHGTPSC